MHNCIFIKLVPLLQAAINETLVLPNCESVCVPWMLAEKDDWVPRKVAPFIWLNQESGNDPIVLREVPSNQPCEEKTNAESNREASTDHPQSKHERLKTIQSIQSVNESSDAASSLTNPSEMRISSLEKLETPLSGNDGPNETEKHKLEEIADNQSSSRSLSMFDKQDDTFEEPKRIGRRARMFDIGKKMGEKLEEKRRHIEEKSRHIVEKMRGP